MIFNSFYILLNYILLRDFVSVRDAGMYFSFYAFYLSGLDIRVILASQN